MLLKAQKPSHKKNTLSPRVLAAYLSSYLNLSFSTRANHYSRQDILKPVHEAHHMRAHTQWWRSACIFHSWNNCSPKKLHISHSKLTIKYHVPDESQYVGACLAAPGPYFFTSHGTRWRLFTAISNWTVLLCCINDRRHINRMFWSGSSISFPDS